MNSNQQKQLILLRELEAIEQETTNLQVVEAKLEEALESTRGNLRGFPQAQASGEPGPQSQEGQVGGSNVHLQGECRQ